MQLTIDPCMNFYAVGLVWYLKRESLVPPSQALVESFLGSLYLIKTMFLLQDQWFLSLDS